jgi:hypothetical protein
MSVIIHPVVEEHRHCFPLPALRRLGASTGVRYCRHDDCGGGIQEVQALFVSCPREAWVREFGQPQHVVEYFDAACGKWVSRWQHDLPQGRIGCTGQIFRRATDDDWIVVRQITFCHLEEPAVTCGANG